MYYFTDKKTDPKLSEILAVAFPKCKLRQYSVNVSEQISISGTYWDGGCRNSYVAVDLVTLEKVDLPHFNPPQFGGPAKDYVFDLVNNQSNRQVCVVEHTQSGVKEYITFHFAPDNVSKLITTQQSDLTNNEKIVLFATRSLVSSYGGDSNYRYNSAFDATKISKQEWNDAIISLIDKKLLRRNKSITPAGKNAIGNLNYWPQK